MLDRLYPYHSGAGRSAREKYESVSDHWRVRVFRHPQLILTLLATPVIVVALIDRSHVWLWLLGVLLGTLLGAYLVLRDTPPWPVENWRRGYEGERRTAQALAPLRRRGYSLLHDIPDRRSRNRTDKGNVDHVVICSAGVFLLDTKWFVGEVEVSGDTIRVRNQDDEDANVSEYDWIAKAMRARATRLQQDIGRNDVTTVRAVVVFWSKFPQGLVESDELVYVHGDRLRGWFERQIGPMSTDWVKEVALKIRSARPDDEKAQ